MRHDSLFAIILSFILFQGCHKNIYSPGLNEIQVIGSHNSYKMPIEEPIWDYIFQVDSAQALSLQYGHISILEQLNMGLRNIELDVFHDPEGGHFSNPKGLEIVRQMGKEPLEYDLENKLEEPGLKMFHIQDIDFRSHFLLFKDCLKMMKEWSASKPDHTPVIVLMNTKDQQVAGTRDPLPFTRKALDSLDMEIRSVFSDEDLITPDFVRGKFQTLEEAVLTRGWPELCAVKGRFLFVLDEKEERINEYLEGHPSLRGRVLFVNSPESDPEAAFRIVNDPVANFAYIQELVKKGYMVRTRADSGTKEARTNNYTRFRKAVESGAQVISTDYYQPSALFNSPYEVNFERNIFERIKTH